VDTVYFGGDPNHRLDRGVVFLIRHPWEIRKVVIGHKSAAHADSVDGSTGKTCFGEVCTVPVLIVHVLEIEPSPLPDHAFWNSLPTHVRRLDLSFDTFYRQELIRR